MPYEHSSTQRAPQYCRSIYRESDLRDCTPYAHLALCSRSESAWSARKTVQCRRRSRDVLAAPARYPRHPNAAAHDRAYQAAAAGCAAPAGDAVRKLAAHGICTCCSRGVWRRCLLARAFSCHAACRPRLVGVRPLCAARSVATQAATITSTPPGQDVSGAAIRRRFLVCGVPATLCGLLAGITGRG